MKMILAVFKTRFNCKSNRMACCRIYYAILAGKNLLSVQSTVNDSHMPGFGIDRAGYCMVYSIGKYITGGKE